MLPVILVVDDVMENIRLLGTLLRPLGQIVFARDGFEALEQVARQRPSLVLLDVLMPGMDGYETCRRLKADPASCDIPVIFITGADAESDEAMGLAIGAIDYITKPFAPAIVQARVRNQLALVLAKAEVAAQAAQLERQNDTLLEHARLREEVERIGRHDLKTPLTSIIGIPRLLREQGRLLPEDAEMLAIVERAGYRVLRMVNLSLDLFKMERGSYRFRPQAVDLLAVLGAVLLDLSSSANARRLRFDLQVDGQAPAAGARVGVRAEELLCYSMIANLLKNAIEAAHEGECISLAVRTGAAVLLEIHNSAPVPEVLRERFFEKYASAGKEGGAGLGTYSARLMARVQEGDIEMVSSARDGTTVSVRLHPGPAPAAAPEHAAAPAPLAPGQLAPHNVLLVDDDEFNLLVMRRYLPSPPLRVRTADNGRDAVEAVLAERADVILMDLEMPLMNGFDATVRLRQIEHELGRAPSLIVAMSSHDDVETRRRSLAAGCDLYLARPVTREQLWQTLQRAAASAPAAAPPAPLAVDPVLIDADLRAALPAFLASRRAALASMVQACESGDAGQVRQLAHRLAGSFDLYGFRWAAQHCKRIEREVDRLEQAQLAAMLAALTAHLDQARIEFVVLASSTEEKPHVRAEENTAGR